MKLRKYANGYTSSIYYRQYSYLIAQIGCQLEETCSMVCFQFIVVNVLEEFGTYITKLAKNVVDPCTLRPTGPCQARHTGKRGI